MTGAYKNEMIEIMINMVENPTAFTITPLNAGPTRNIRIRHFVLIFLIFVYVRVVTECKAEAKSDIGDCIHTAIDR